MFNFNFDKVCITSHSIYLRRFRPKTVFVLTTKPRWKLLSSAVTIKVFINLTIYLSSDFYEIIEFLKISSDYILFICVVSNQNRFLHSYANRGGNYCVPQYNQGLYQTLQCIYLRIFMRELNFSKISPIT